jgi:hypothetical protein
MLSAATKERLKKLGLDIDKLEAAIKDEAEQDVAIPEGQLLTEAQLTERDAQKVKEGKSEGETLAKATLIKEVATKTGITITGERIADLVTGIKEGLNADKDTKFKTLQEQNTALLADKETLAAKATQAEQALKNGMFEVGILAKLPPHAAGLTAKESLELAKMRGYTPEQTDTGVVWKKNGEILKDPVTHAPLAEDKAIATIWDSEKWGGTPTPVPTGGRGGGDGNPSPGAGIKTQSAAVAKWKEENPNKNEVSPECTNYVLNLAKADPSFDMAK